MEQERAVVVHHADEPRAGDEDAIDKPREAARDELPLIRREVRGEVGVKGDEVVVEIEDGARGGGWGRGEDEMPVVLLLLRRGTGYVVILRVIVDARPARSGHGFGQHVDHTAADVDVERSERQAG